MYDDRKTAAASPLCEGWEESDAAGGLCELIRDGTLTENAAFAKYPRLKNAIVEMLKSQR